MSDFPPQDLRSFLEFCAGDWLSVRSCFDLREPQPLAGLAGNEAPAAESPVPDEPPEHWHAALRGELQVLFLDPAQAGDPGGLRVTPPQAAGGAASIQELVFDASGGFQRHPGVGSGSIRGRWRFWPDGSLELVEATGEAVVRERIWFTKPNLRLRSSIEQRPGGRPARASFASEIRRVSRPTTPAAPAATTAAGAGMSG
ncbi:MAG: phycobiliprotein lyase [Cyanobium sp.]